MASLIDDQMPVTDTQGGGGSPFDGLGQLYHAVTAYLAPQGGKSLLESSKRWHNNPRCGPRNPPRPRHPTT